MPTAIDRVLTQLHTVILGKERPIRLAVCCLLARGHLLIEASLLNQDLLQQFTKPKGEQSKKLLLS